MEQLKEVSNTRSERRLSDAAQLVADAATAARVADTTARGA